MARKRKYEVSVIDFETDPFLHGRVPKPFCVEFHSEKLTAVFWGDDCANQLVEFLNKQDQCYLIYAHNGGKFDFHFLHSALDNPALIIKTRIVEATLGKHKLRDSFAILPMPLRDYRKMQFDYSKMETENRAEFKNEILEYLHDDCVQLFALVNAFVKRFGPKMTIGSAAIGEIEKIHPFNKMGSRHDNVFRSFYYGGRVQCFDSGILKGPWKLVDVNSMYSKAMEGFMHPVNGSWDMSRTLPDNFNKPFFIRFFGNNRNALPSRDDEGNLIFTNPRGWFNACSHELKIALEYGLVDIEEIEYCYIAQDTINFKEFVDVHFKEKADCKRNGDKINEIFAKFLLNSGYGRFGINPENFEEWFIHRDFGNDEELENNGYTKQVDYDDIELWSKKADITENQYCDVAIAASITSAARSLLLEGLQKSLRPIYCDTDSIICADFYGDMDPFRLGAWDLEKESEFVAIAGKKMYALYDNIKVAKKLSSKGGTLSLSELIRMCNGETILYHNAAPTFSIKRPVSFVTRNFRKTVDAPEPGEYP